jgi:serine/threonine protein kinase
VLANILQEFRGEIVVWSRLNHPNVLRCFGVTVDPLRILTEWMSNGQAMEYVRTHQDADRVGLVSSPDFATQEDELLYPLIAQLIDVAQGLDYLHSHGIVHGNLKQVGHLSTVHIPAYLY